LYQLILSTTIVYALELKFDFQIYDSKILLLESKKFRVEFVPQMI
jgi:hypothetical protein